MTINLDDNVINMLLNFTHFDNPRTPKSKKYQVTYENVIGGDLAGSVVEMLELGTQQRRLLVQALTYAGSTPNPQNLIGAVNAYIPAVWHIQKSLEFSKNTKIKIKAPLHFEWTSVLKNDLGDKNVLSQVQGVFVFELTFVLIARAVSHYNLARQHVERIFTRHRESGGLNPSDPFIAEALKQSIAQLKIGAGVLEFAANDVISQWKKPPSDPLPETRPPVLNQMVQFFLCQAQKVFIARVLLSEKIHLVPSLLLGLADRYEATGTGLMKEMSQVNGINTQCVKPEYTDECFFWRSFCVILARKYTSLNIRKKIEKDEIDVSKLEEMFGVSVGHMRLAVQSLKNKSLNKSVSGALKSRLAGLFKRESGVLRGDLSEIEAENSSIYYAAVDLDECNLPPKSGHKFLVKLEKFVMPEVNPLSFKQILKAPPGMVQAEFDALPEDMKKELIADYKQKEEERLKKEKKKNKGLFGKKKKKKQQDNSALPPLVCPPGVNEKIFQKKTREEQEKIVAAFTKTKTTTVTPAPTSAVLTAPAGIDPADFAALPRDIQLELINAQTGGGAAPTQPVATATAKTTGKKKKKKDDPSAPIW